MNDGIGPIVKLAMFLSSYSPLFVMLAIRFEERSYRIGFLIAGGAGLIFVCVVLWLTKKSSSTSSYTLETASAAGSEASSYLAGYLLPFLTVSRPGLWDMLGYFAFFLVAGLVHWRTALIQVNPTLFLFGFRILRVRTDGGFEGYLLTRGEILLGEPITATRIANDVIMT